MTTDCFRTQSNELVNVTDVGDTPCGNTSNGFSPCCRKEDQCLEDNICHFTRSGTGTSGYYIASCTDESGKDSSCLQTCSQFICPSTLFDNCGAGWDQSGGHYADENNLLPHFLGGNALPDIVYIEADTLWHCCKIDAYAGITDCSSPTNFTFQAPAPEKLAIFASSSTSLSASLSTSFSSASSASSLLSSMPSSFTQSSSTTSDISSTSTSSPTPNSDSGLSTGAKAGIGVGIALGIVCFAVLLKITFLIRKRQQQQRDNVISSYKTYNLKGEQEKGNNGTGATEIQRPLGAQQSRHELQGQARDSELDPSRGAFYEMEVRR